MKLLEARDISHSTIRLSDGGSYSRNPPICRELNKLSDSLKTKYQSTWSSLATYPPLELYLCSDLVSVDQGYLFYGERLLEESVLHLDCNEREAIYSRFFSNSLGPRIKVRACALNLKRRSSTNYGHWIIEFMPWYFLANQLGVDFEHIVLESLSRNPMGPIQQQTLLLNKPESTNLIFRANSQPHFFSKLLVPSRGCVHSHTKHPLLVSTARSVGLSQIEPAEANPSSTRIYIARQQSMTRNVVNDRELQLELQRQGFLIVYPERHSHAEQISIFHSASLVLGVSGAAMTNIVYCKTNTRIICLCPSNANEYFFWDIASQLGQEFEYIFCESLGPNHRSPIIVDIPAVVDSILA